MVIRHLQRTNVLCQFQEYKPKGKEGVPDIAVSKAFNCSILNWALWALEHAAINSVFPPNGASTSHPPCRLCNSISAVGWASCPFHLLTYPLSGVLVISNSIGPHDGYAPYPFKGLSLSLIRYGNTCLTWIYIGNFSQKKKNSKKL